jgi:hypothetical protein
VYLIKEDVVRQIRPLSIRHTNLGEPYAKLVRLNYFFSAEVHDENYRLSIDFAPEHGKALRELLC